MPHGRTVGLTRGQSTPQHPNTQNTRLHPCNPLPNIGKHVLYGHDSRAATGWFIGCVQSRNPTARDLKQVPTTNFVVEYTAKLTNKKLFSKVACELITRTHVATEWWVLVEKENGKGQVLGQAEQPVEATGATRCLDIWGKGRVKGRA